MSRRGRIWLAGALGALGLGALAGPAHAGIWTEIPSNAGTAEITAIEYRGADKFWFTTGNGKIFRRVGGSFVEEYSEPGVVFRDIEFDATGTIGLAVGTGGRLVRTDDGGDDWDFVPMPNGRDADSEINCTVSEPAGALDSVRFDGQGHPWIAGGGAQVWRSTGTGALGSWIDANDGPGTTCLLLNRDIDGMVFVPGSAAGYFITRAGEAFFSSEPSTTSASDLLGDAGNGFLTLRRAAGDPVNTGRMWTVTPGEGTSYVKRTTDGWNSGLSWELGNPDKRGFSKAYDVDYAGGTVLAAGDAGMVLHSIDGETFFFNDADGVIATQNWRAASLADGANGAIGGTNGKLAITTAANATPDIVKPTGTIAGPAGTPAGQPVAFTLNAADEGGSGLNAGSFAWTSAGLPAASGNPATFTFPSPGFYTVKVTFADNAGNTAEATTSIQVTRATATGGGGSNPLTSAFDGRGNGATAKIVGNRVRVRARGTVALPAGVSCAGRVKLTIKRKKTTLAKRTVKLKRKGGKCRFGKTVFIKRSKVGRTTTRLRLKVSITRNPALRTASLTKTLVIKK